MGIKHLLRMAVLSCLVGTLAGGCSDKKEEEPSGIEVTLNLNPDLSPITDEVIPQTLSEGDGLRLRYIVDIYAQTGKQLGQRVLRRVVYPENNDPLSITATLPFEKYRVMAWTDYIGQDSQEDLFYLTGDLRKVAIKGNPHVGCNDGKDAFSGCLEFDIRGYKGSKVTIPQSVTMTRPHGKYRIETTDLAQYEERAAAQSGNPVPSYAVVTFPRFYPYGYDCVTSLAYPGAYREGVTYRSPVTTGADNTAVLAFDYVFISNASETVVTANMSIYDDQDRLINTIEGIRIPIYRNKVTVIRNQFLTKDFQGGNMGIEDGFDDEIVIELPE